MFLYLINYHIQNISKQNAKPTLHTPLWHFFLIAVAVYVLLDVLLWPGAISRAMDKLHTKPKASKSKFRARIRRIPSLSPSKIVTRFRRVRLTGQIHKIHLPKPSTAHQEYRMLKNFQMIFNVYMCVSCVCGLMRISRSDKEVRVLQFWCVNSSGLAATPQAEHSLNETWQTWHWSCWNNNLFCLWGDIFTGFAATADKIDLPTSSAETTPNLWSLAAVLRLLLRCKGATALPWKTS